MSDRIAVFNNGAVHQVGTPDEIYQRPSNLFVASFIGETNAVEVSLETHSGPNGWHVRSRHPDAQGAMHELVAH